MADFHQIWKFIEKKMGVTVPPYIKYVLKYCGYENCHTISTIEDSDFEYMETEVRKGSIIEYYKGELQETDILGGSMKRIEQFEIIRGHRKLIKAAVTLVKENLEENGVNSFLAASPKRKNKAKTDVKSKTETSTMAEGKQSRPGKKPKLSPIELLSESMLQSIDEGIDDPLVDPHIKHHKHDLLVKGLSHLKYHNSALYDEMNVNKKFTEDSVQVEKKSPDSEQYAGKLECPFCSEKINVFHKITTSEYGSWNTSNFERHLTLVHADTFIPYEKIVKKPAKLKSYKKLADCIMESRKDEPKDQPKDQPKDEPERLELPSDPKIENKDVVGEDNTSLKKLIGPPIKLEFSNNIEGATGFDNLEIKYGDKIDDATQIFAYTVLSTYNQDDYIPTHLDEPILTPVDITSNVPSTHEANEDYALIIVPSMSGKHGIAELKCDNNGMIEDSSLAGLENSGNLFDLSNISNEIPSKIHNRVGERLIFRNGGYTNDGSWDGSRLIHTRNTCGFDSILETYAALYFDHQEYREFLDVAHIFFRCDFTTLVHEYFQTNSLTPKLQVMQIHSAWESLNRNRNIILKTIFSDKHYAQSPNMKVDDRFTYIDCRTGLGEFFAQLASKNLILSSAIEAKTCHNCKSTTTKIVPFFSIGGINLELNNIQRSIDEGLGKKRLCVNCKAEITFNRVLNKILVIDIEPSRDVRNKKKISLQHLSRTIKPENDNEYKLFAVIEFNPILCHFTALVERKIGGWAIFDDLQISETKLDETKDIIPFMLFYTTQSKGNSFKKAFIEKISSTELNSYDSNAKGSTGRPVQNVGAETITSKVNKITLSSSSNTEWKKIRENGWRY